MPSPRHRHSGLGLLAIGLFKLTKAVLLVGLGVASLYGREHDLGELAEHWLKAISGRMAGSLVDSLVSRLSSVDEKTLRNVAFGSFAVAALFLVEGTGLCLRKRWAEFLTLAMTASLLPVEIYELARHFTAPRVVVLVINLAIVAYLIIQVRRREPVEMAAE